MMSILHRITTKGDLKRGLAYLLSFLFVAVVPKAAEQSTYNWIERRFSARIEKRIRAGSNEIVRRIKAVIGEQHSDASVDEIAASYYRMKLEDQWARACASHSPQCSVTTDVVNLHHLTDAQRSGRGIVLWGTSFCGTLFPKIALARAGVSLTQLSLFDHGRSHLNTLVGRRITQPLYCMPENQFLTERIVIPDSADRSYLFRIGEVLKSNGCIWIACHGARNQRHLAVEMLGHTINLPAGAPTIAMRHKAVLIPTHTKRLGKFNYQVILGAPIELDPDLKRREAVQRIVQEYADLLGRSLIDQPASWHWSHAPIACGIVQSNEPPETESQLNSAG